MIDRLSVALGKATAWLTLLMVVVTFVVVVMRYVFGVGLIWLQESVVWMHAFVFMVGAAYTLQQDGHVRVDIFYRRQSERGRAWVNIIGVVVFLAPLCAYLAFKSSDFAYASWKLAESSRESGGLPYPLIPLLKSILVVMPVMVLLQGVSLLLSSLSSLRSQ